MGDLTINQLELLAQDLEAYKIEHIQEEEKLSESNIEKIWNLKYVLIIGASIPIFVISQVLQELQIGEFIENSLFYGLAIIGVLFTIYAIERRSRQQPKK